MFCPNSPAGCECSHHAEGLRAHAPDKAAFDAMLEPIRERNVRPLRLLDDVARHSMTCACGQCSQRRREVAENARGGEKRCDPFVPRPSRHARKAA